MAKPSKPLSKTMSLAETYKELRELHLDKLSYPDPDKLVPGTLVRIRDIPGWGGDPDSAANGALWVLDKPYGPDDPDMYWATALATGYRYLWYIFEFEIGDQDNECV